MVNLGLLNDLSKIASMFSDSAHGGHCLNQALSYSRQLHPVTQEFSFPQTVTLGVGNRTQRESICDTSLLQLCVRYSIQAVTVAVRDINDDMSLLKNKHPHATTSALTCEYTT